MASYADRVQARARARGIGLAFWGRTHQGFPSGLATFYDSSSSHAPRLEVTTPRDRLGYLCALHEEGHIVLRLSSNLDWVRSNSCYRRDRSIAWNIIEAEARCWLYAIDHYAKPIPRSTYHLILNEPNMYLRSYMDLNQCHDTPGVRKLKRMMKNAAA